MSCRASGAFARHSRCYDKETFIYNPLHYLALLERKPNALDQAAPLQHRDLPEEFEHLRRLLEARMGKKGRKEYIQVLRLMETFGDVEVRPLHSSRFGTVVRGDQPALRERRNDGHQQSAVR